MKLCAFFVFAVLATGFECSRILVVYPTISKSHLIPMNALTEALASKGHDITVVSTYPHGKKLKNYREVRIPFDEADKEFLSEIAKDPKGSGMMTLFPKLMSMMLRVGNETLQLTEVKKLMKEESFDLLIVGVFIMTENMLGLGDHFKCPTILFSPAGGFGVMNQAVGNPLAVAGAPHLMLPSKTMDFVARLKTFLASGGELLAMEYMKYKSRQVYDFHFPADRYRSYDESLRNVSLTLINVHFSSTAVRPNLPNVIEVGGIQVKPKPSPLPEKLQAFLDNATEGAVFFSLGSNAKSTYLSKETLNTILSTFRQLKKHRFVMKWEADSMEGQPENVFISKWLPQDDVLAHPNIKAFISHCGLGGVAEAKYHGVPIIGLPLFGDQPGNAQQIANEGWSIQMDLSTITENSLKGAIVEILGNPKYSTTVKKLSDLARDRPLNAQDTAIFWVEYVLRHRGAPHMHFPGADQNFFQSNSIDVILFLFAVVYIVLKTIALVCKKICCGTSKTVDKKKQKRN